MEVIADREEEARRRLRCLGGNAQDAQLNYDHLFEQAIQTRILLPVLTGWWKQFKAKDLQGLIPEHWQELLPEDRSEMENRFSSLGLWADKDNLTNDDIQALADKNHWSWRTSDRWLTRYRIGGKFGLLSKYNPLKKERPEQPPRDIGSLDDEDLNTMYQRMEWIKPLLEKPQPLTDKDIESRVADLLKDGIKISCRSIRNYIARYKRYGIAGLVDKKREDAGQFHNISERMKGIIIGIRLSKKDAPLTYVHEEACKRAKALGEVEPSPWQVRSILDKIPTSDRVLADGRIEKDKNWVITYPIHLPKGDVIYMADTTLVDVLVLDMRKGEVHKAGKPKEIRPYLTLILEASSRANVAGFFSYDRPDRFIIAAAIREALLTREDKPCGGVPDEIWVDNGKEFISNHVRQLCRELNIDLNVLHPHSPQIKGRVERFFGTLNTRLWSRLDGYVGSNVVERNPSVKGKLSLKELIEQFNQFIDQYHHEVHSQTGETPLDFFAGHCYTTPVDPRRLDVLLKEPKSAKVGKMGIKHLGKYYWHSMFSAIVGKRVTIRSAPAYDLPEEIEVFVDGYWYCTAIYTESPRGLSVTRDEVNAAKHAQKTEARERIKNSREALKETDEEIKKSQPRKPRPKQPKVESEENPKPLGGKPAQQGKPKDIRLSDIFNSQQ